MGELVIVCDTPTCPDYGTEVNRVTLIDDVEAAIEAWRPGDDENDRCETCGHFGRLEDENE